MNLKPLATNMTEVETDKYLVLFSYKTPVAYLDKHDNSVFETNKKWSNTTTRHISKWLAIQWPTMKREEVHTYKVDQSTLDNLLNEVK